MTEALNPGKCFWRQELLSCFPKWTGVYQAKLRDEQEVECSHPRMGGCVNWQCCGSANNWPAWSFELRGQTGCVGRSSRNKNNFLGSARECPYSTAQWDIEEAARALQSLLPYSDTSASLIAPISKPGLSHLLSKPHLSSLISKDKLPKTWTGYIYFSLLSCNGSDLGFCGQTGSPCKPVMAASLLYNIGKIIYFLISQFPHL